MPILNVGPNSTFPSITAAMIAAGPGDTIVLETGYSNETAVVTHGGMTVFGGATSTGIVLQLATGIAVCTLTGTAPINVFDAPDGNNIVGNDGNNVITVTDGADAVSGGLGTDRLVVDYSLATGAVTGNSTSNFAEAGGSRLVTITDGTFEHFTVFTGSGADTITTGAGDDIIHAGNGANTITAGQGANIIIGGINADTITALDGGNFIDGGDGTNTITSGGGDDIILSGVGADTIVAGGGLDVVTVRGGADSVNAGAGNDRLIVDYSAFTTDVLGGVTGGDLMTGYTGHIADSTVNMVDFVETENFTITTGSGNDVITTGGGQDVLSSAGGNDVLDGGAGVDIMIGGVGNDAYYVDSGVDAVVENFNEGIDTVFSTDHLVLGANLENLTLIGGDLQGYGNSLDNVITGTAGANLLDGRAGVDTMIGGAGNDLYYVDSGIDAVVENLNEGIDTVFSTDHLVAPVIENDGNF